MEDHDTSLPLIRTGIRDKLPKGLSHPVGAEVISRALHGCPRYDELWTAFSSGPLAVNPRPIECIDFGLAFVVVCNNSGGGWYLSVPAVPSALRSVVRGLLTSTGLSAVREWLCKPRPETWYEGFRTFQVGYTVDPLRVCLIESLNYKVVASSVIAVEPVAGQAT